MHAVLRYPVGSRARLEQYQHDEPSLKAFGLDVVSHLCMDLLDNEAPGLHFYALNKIEPAREVCLRLGLVEHQLENNGAAA